MPKLTREDLMPLEHYHAARQEFRRKVIDHKATRQITFGGHATLYFEDRLTIQYQIQEMLRVERIFEAEAIEDELNAYNPLIPDGDNWKATFMIEYPDIEERRVALERLVGIEHQVWTRVGDLPPVYAIADEDMERSRETKTSAVHFVRFQLTPAMVEAAKAGAPIAIGIDHPQFMHAIDPLPQTARDTLVADLA